MVDIPISGMDDPNSALYHIVVHLFGEPPGGHFEQLLREREISRVYQLRDLDEHHHNMITSLRSYLVTYHIIGDAWLNVTVADWNRFLRMHAMTATGPPRWSIINNPLGRILPPPRVAEMKDSKPAASSLVGSNKRKRCDGSAEEQKSAAVWVFPLANLPSGAIQSMVSFQTAKERASLRLTCVSLCTEVETFCKQALVGLKIKHRVDDTFDARIRDQTGLGTTLTKPVILPFFYLLWKAMRTHLYKLEPPVRNNAAHCIHLQLSKSGDRIVLTCAAGVRLWDLESKQQLRVIDAFEGDYPPHQTFLIEDAAIVCHDMHTISFWSQTDGSLVREHRIPGRHGFCKFLEFNGTLFFYDNFGSHIHKFDVRTGAFSVNFWTTYEQDFEDHVPRSTFASVTDCGWLVAWTVVGHVAAPVSNTSAEVHVFDLADGSLKNVFRGDQHTNIPRHLEPYPKSGLKKMMVCCQGRTSRNVLDLNDGSLMHEHPHSSLPLECSCIVPATSEHCVGFFFSTVSAGL